MGILVLEWEPDCFGRLMPEVCYKKFFFPSTTNLNQYVVLKMSNWLWVHYDRSCHTSWRCIFSITVVIYNHSSNLQSFVFDQAVPLLLYDVSHQNCRYQETRHRQWNVTISRYGPLFQTNATVATAWRWMLLETDNSTPSSSRGLGSSTWHLLPFVNELTLLSHSQSGVWGLVEGVLRG
jgi:hypothetical protein